MEKGGGNVEKVGFYSWPELWSKIEREGIGMIVSRSVRFDDEGVAEDPKPGCKRREVSPFASRGTVSVTLKT